MHQPDQAQRPAVVVQGVRKSFGALEVLRGIDLTVRPGATTAIIGPSGSGKSTLVRCINRLEQIHGGSITIGDTVITADGIRQSGRRLNGAGIARFRAGIGLVFQSFNLFPHRTVMGNLIEAPTGVLGLAKDEAKAKAMDLLRQIGLEDKVDSYPARLSGGQQQRVAIARALMMDPGLMLFDEPTSALDPELTGEVLRVIAALAIRGRTSIIVTHEIGFAREIADWVVFMDGGQIVEQGPPHQVLDAPATERAGAFLGRLSTSHKAERSEVNA